MLLRVNKLKKLGFQDNKIYSGENWVDLPRDATEYAINYFESHPNLRKMLVTGAFSDEFWLPMIFCNNAQLKKRIVQNIHRYIVWEKRYGSRPAILDETDLSLIQAGDYFWARKVVFGISDKLVEGLSK